jgi:23S rRNA (uracil1939-C5)-methyltransferase
MAMQHGPAPISPPTTAAQRPERGAELELTVGALAFGGAGVARLDGYVVFVAGAVPGDRVRAAITQRKRSYAHARLLEVLDPGPDRIPERAPHPGVPWQVLPYERQLAIKHEQVEDALRRLGRLDAFELQPIVPAGEHWRYRNKLEYSFGTAPTGDLVCGFHEPGRWDRIVALDDCLLASEAGNAVREAVLGWARGQGLTAHDRRTGEGVLRNLVVREGRRTGQLQVRLVTSPGELELSGLVDALAACGAGLLWTQSAERAETTSGGRTALIAGPAQLEESVAGLTLGISPEAFFQTNTEMADELYRVASEYTGLQGWERVYDLYSGIGTIGLVLAPRAGELLGLELVEEAVRDARANAARNDVARARFEVADVRLALRDLVQRSGRPDVVVVDPPRAGLSAKVVRRIIEAAPRRIVYVSCNPTTLAPNASQLVEAGWELRRVRAVDMFPQTPHIECVALLERR